MKAVKDEVNTTAAKTTKTFIEKTNTFIFRLLDFSTLN